MSDDMVDLPSFVALPKKSAMREPAVYLERRTPQNRLIRRGLSMCDAAPHTLDDQPGRSRAKIWRQKAVFSKNFLPLLGHGGWTLIT
jgi:hypothetical protein